MFPVEFDFVLGAIRYITSNSILGHLVASGIFHLTLSCFRSYQVFSIWLDLTSYSILHFRLTMNLSQSRLCFFHLIRSCLALKISFLPSYFLPSFLPSFLTQARADIFRLISLQKKYFFVYDMSSSGCSHVVLLLTNEEQKRVARDVFDTCATHSGLVHDVTTGQQNVSTRGHVFVTF